MACDAVVKGIMQKDGAKEIDKAYVTHPVLPRDIPHTSHRYIRYFERLQIRLGLIVPYLDLTITTHPCQHDPIRWRPRDA